MPKTMSLDVAQTAANRILEHCHRHDFNNVDISLHGGEPLLVGREHLQALVKTIRAVLEPHCRLSIGLQSNGVLLDQRMLDVIEKEGLAVGISLDGPPRINDKVRVFRNGRGSGLQVEKALGLLQGSRAFGGILCVIDVRSDPLEVFEYLCSFNPPALDFLLPHGTWDRRPPGKQSSNHDYGVWLARIFDAWISGSRGTISVRLFDEIIVRLTGNPGSLESMGLEPVALAVVASDGSYEGVDTLKAVYPKAHVLGLRTATHSLDDVMNHPFIAARQQGAAALGSQCQKCDLVNICGGGYLPHRYSHAGGFQNTSVFCEDLEFLIRHVESHLRKLIKASQKEARTA